MKEAGISWCSWQRQSGTIFWIFCLKQTNQKGFTWPWEGCQLVPVILPWTCILWMRQKTITSWKIFLSRGIRKNWFRISRQRWNASQNWNCGRLPGPLLAGWKRQRMVRPGTAWLPDISTVQSKIWLHMQNISASLSRLTSRQA